MPGGTSGPPWGRENVLTSSRILAFIVREIAAITGDVRTRRRVNLIRKWDQTYRRRYTFVGHLSRSCTTERLLTQVLADCLSLFGG